MTLKWVKNGQKNMIQLFDFFSTLAEYYDTTTLITKTYDL